MVGSEEHCCYKNRSVIFAEWGKKVMPCSFAF